eukprot:GHVT01082871.1.p2 GENE.GHVT01082871.1~~GHVT01082871.1.p2  ORF type:complete len:336 (+),score=46.92 GHVT01082871.1:3533-4540(+)
MMHLVKSAAPAGTASETKPDGTVTPGTAVPTPNQASTSDAATTAAPAATGGAGVPASNPVAGQFPDNFMQLLLGANPGMGGDMGGAMGGAMGGGMGAPPGGGIGNVGGLDPQMFAQVVQNPMMRQMMQELAGNPEMMRALMRNNPMMNQMTAHNPGLRNLFESPDVLQGLSSMMSNPETMQRMSQMQAAFQSAPQAQADGAAPTGVQERSDTPATTAVPAAPPGAPNFENMIQQAVQAMEHNPELMGNIMQSMGYAGGALPGMQSQASPPMGGMGGPPMGMRGDSRPPAERFSQQLQSLSEMGFIDRDANIQALQETGGDVNAAISRLLERGIGN